VSGRHFQTKEVTGLQVVARFCIFKSRRRWVMADWLEKDFAHIFSETKIISDG
jgi:hypothetical protein